VEAREGQRLAGEARLTTGQGLIVMTDAEREKAVASDWGTCGTLQTDREDARALSVLLIEEDDLIRESLLDWLASVLVDARLVGGSIDEVEALAEDERPAVIVVDIALIGRDGIEVVADLHRAFPEAKIVALSMAEDQERREAVLAAGAAACLPAWEVSGKLEATLDELLEAS